MFLRQILSNALFTSCSVIYASADRPCLLNSRNIMACILSVLLLEFIPILLLYFQATQPGKTKWYTALLTFMDQLLDKTKLRTKP